MAQMPTTWPKPYLLEIYRRAIEEGCVRITLPTAAHAKSLAQAFYRLRRRSDAQHAAFIKPEYHLVTCAWEAARGTLLVTYNALPDGSELPAIESVTDRTTSAPLPTLAKPVVFRETNEGEDLDEVFNVEDFMESLVNEAGKKLDND